MPDWISPDEERDLLAHLEALAFAPVRMHGMVAKRTVVHFGWDYGYNSWRITPTRPVPHWLLPLRGRAAELMQEPEHAVEEVLITRYDAGAGIGWHRDAPMFGPTVVGLSLKGLCRMRFERHVKGLRETAEQILDPRSAYILSGSARSAWRHSIPPTKTQRYSITFRTVRTMSG